MNTNIDAYNTALQKFDNLLLAIAPHYDSALEQVSAQVYLNATQLRWGTIAGQLFAERRLLSKKLISSLTLCELERYIHLAETLKRRAELNFPLK